MEFLRRRPSRRILDGVSRAIAETGDYHGMS